ncbi:DUF6644 family protein [Sphingomonas bacterium]|uniref:DUF6644 family protein n=1 Tax=Sphingomonas bacterium TaxID=1895847 RepID=UPI0015752EC8|nr:DUF6644 family protein [Sphingomonas bacterium]
MSLTNISDWLAGTELSQAIASRNWTVPTLQSIHILSIGVVMASVAVLDLRLAGFLAREQSMRDYNLRFYPWIWGALCVLLGTGTLQIMAEPARELLNWIFLTKMGLLVAAVIFTASVRGLLEDRRFRDMPLGRRTVIRTCALVSLGLWVAIVVCGRWIAYAGGQV